MERVALTGFTLTIMGAMGILASELVGTAFAGRDGSGYYIAALSNGAALRLIPTEVVTQRAATAPDQPGHSLRLLQCQRLIDAGAFQVGLHCRAP